MFHCSLFHLTQQGTVSGFGQVEIRLARLLGFLLEAVQDIDSLGDLGDVDHPERPVSVSDANFPHALANGGHWLPVSRLEPPLHLVELVSHFLSDRRWERSEVSEGATSEIQGFVF